MTVTSIIRTSIGRRVLESYYLLFIHEVAQGRGHHDYDRLTSRALNTYFLGEHVAPLWSLGRVLLWVPTAAKETLRTARTQNADSELTEALTASPGIAKSVGLYKVMGEAVQAVVGGVYHQFVRDRLPLPRRLQLLMTWRQSFYLSRCIGWLRCSSIIPHANTSAPFAAREIKWGSRGVSCYSITNL